MGEINGKILKQINKFTFYNFTSGSIVPKSTVLIGLVKWLKKRSVVVNT